LTSFTFSASSSEPSLDAAVSPSRARAAAAAAPRIISRVLVARSSPRRTRDDRSSETTELPRRSDLASVDDDGWTDAVARKIRFAARRVTPPPDARTAREKHARTMENDDTERSRSRGRRTVDAVGVGL